MTGKLRCPVCHNEKIRPVHKGKISVHLDAAGMPCEKGSGEPWRIVIVGQPDYAGEIA